MADSRDYFGARLFRLAIANPHLRPLVAAHLVGKSILFWEQPGAECGYIPPIPTLNKNTVVLICDDMDKSLGPSPYDQKKLQHYISRAAHISLVICEPLELAYGYACSPVIHHNKIGLIIESRPEHEADWWNYIQKYKGDCTITLCTIKAEGSA